MARFAIGDIQGCGDELQKLVQLVGFSSDRDQIWFVGDLVNRGPTSLKTLRYVRSLGENAVVVLGNHDLHLLALAYNGHDKRKEGDTLDEILSAPDRDALLEWLLNRPLAYYDPTHRDLLIHAGVIPQWSLETVLSLAREVEASLRQHPKNFFAHMYGNQPDQWSESLTGMERMRFTVNALTRMRVCTAEGKIDPRMKGKPEKAKPPYRPWFEFEHRRTRKERVIFGHWSALGYRNSGGVVALDTGCVWGGELTALNLDTDAPPVSVPCSGYQLVVE